jgi:L-threonylcarbamoyladenylate synthase
MEMLTLTEAGIGKAAEKAARILKKGGVVLFPTDTVYGLAADAGNPKALAMLREIKGREKKKPISVIVPSIASISTYAVMDDVARSLADRFLPGAITLVLTATSRIPEELTLFGKVGIRIPDDAFCLALAKAFGKPYTATSANRSGRETPASVREALNQFGHHAHDIDLVIDAGPHDGKKPSTVVTVTDGIPYVLREGAIPREVILAGS